MNRPLNLLVAGVGNVFLGDDGFGVEVARELQRRSLPPEVKVADFGIRGLHLAFELLQPLDRLIVADAVSRDGPPGTLYVIEPELDEAAATADAHGMDLPAVFASLRGMGGEVPPLLLVGCEPQVLDEGMGLSPAVQAAIPGAIHLIEELVEQEIRRKIA